MTYDGTAINYGSGLPESGGHHNFSAASKSGFHLQLLALALDGAAADLSESDIHGAVRAQIAAQIPVSRVLDVLERKMSTL